MNIVIRALRNGDVSLNLMNTQVLDFLFSLLEIPEDFLDLRKVASHPHIQKKIDEAWDSFVLEYAKREILKCKILKDFKKLADQVFSYVEFRPDSVVLALDIIYQGWDDFTREHINIKKEILKRKTFFKIYDLFCNLRPNSNSWKKVNKIQSKLALEYIKKEI